MNVGSQSDLLLLNLNVYSDSYMRCYSVSCRRANESLYHDVPSLYSFKVHVALMCWIQCVYITSTHARSYV